MVHEIQPKEDGDSALAGLSILPSPVLSAHTRRPDLCSLCARRGRPLGVSFITEKMLDVTMNNNIVRGDHVAGISFCVAAAPLGTKRWLALVNHDYVVKQAEQAFEKGRCAGMIHHKAGKQKTWSKGSHRISCWRKRRHRTEFDAQQAINQLRRHSSYDGHELVAYECSACGGDWHGGHAATLEESW